MTSIRLPEPDRHRRIEGPDSSLIFLPAIGFVIGHPLVALYASNQNTKFLHGLAQAFPERLGQDWTATTADGMPVFSGLVFLVANFTTPVAFYSLEMALQFLLALSLILILRLSALGRLDATWDRSAAIMAAVAIVASTWDAFWPYMQGLAGQYFTLGYLQPSCFGVLFLLALVLAQRRSAAAVVLAAAPAAVHPGYIAPAVILTLIFLWDQRQRPFGQLAPLVFFAAILLAGPPLDLAIRFHTADRELFHQASEILAFTRIPHHSIPSVWFDSDAAIRIAMIVLATVVAPAGVIRKSMAVLFGFAVIGTLLAMATGNPGIALMAPWRVSVILAPAACAILFGYALAQISRLAQARRVVAVLLLPLSAVAILAVVDGASDKISMLSPEPSEDHIAYIRDTAQTEDVYLTIANRSDFRLAAMAAQYVSWKTHPYQADEVLEWKRRVDLANSIYLGSASGKLEVDCDALANVLRQDRITHVVLMPKSAEPIAICPGLTVAFNGQDGIVARVDQP